jgi:photosystem II stability/assembly factor-like uncharacterized protein
MEPGITGKITTRIIRSLNPRWALAAVILLGMIAPLFGQKAIGTISPSVTPPLAVANTENFFEHSLAAPAEIANARARPQSSSWSQQTSGTANNLFSVHFVNSNEGWAVGFSNTILHTTNGGTNWLAQTNQSGVTVSSYLGVRFLDSNTGWAGGGSAVVRTTDGGASWTSQGATQDGRFRNNLFAVSSTAAWIPAQNATSTLRWFSRFTVGVGEENFNVIGSSSQYFDIYFTDTNNGWAVGTGPIVHITNASSASPSFSFPTCPCPTLNGIHMLDVNTGWTVGNGGLILKTTDGGATWPAQTSGTTTNLRSVHFVDASTGYAVGNGGLILASTDGGVTWAEETSGVTTDLRRVFFVDASTGYAVGHNGTIVKRSTCAAPAITSQPMSLTRSVGQSATFSVMATGAGLTYQWRKGGTNISGATSSSYTIASVATDDAGSYDVVVSGDCNPPVTSDPATLAVNANTPPLLAYSSPQPVFLGSSTLVYPTIGPSDNGSIASLVVQSVTPSGFTGTIMVNSFGVVSVSNAGAAGIYTVTIRATDDTGLMTDAGFRLVVNAQACPGMGFPPSGTGFSVNNPLSVAAGDFNLDGKPDLATSSIDSDIASVVLGDGNGSFGAPTDFPVGQAPVFIAVGDFNRDGKPDLVTANSSSDNVSVLLGNGSGSFGAATDFPAGDNPSSVAVGDFNLDGKPDLVTANSSSDNVSVLLGNGSGSFGAATDFPAGDNPSSVAVGDFNLDGKPDLVTANGNSTNVSVLLGDGSGGFGAATDFPIGANPYSVVVGDFNLDGKPDLAASVATFGFDSVSVLLGNGSGSFGAAVNYSVGDDALSVVVGDFNLDGKPDLAASNRMSHNVSVLLGNGSGGFGAATNFGSGTAPQRAAVGDFNLDGRPDLVTANRSIASVFVLLNINAPPLLAYNSPQIVPVGGSLAVTPSIGPSNNGSVSSVAVQSVTPGSFTGTVMVNSFGVVSISLAGPAGIYTVTIRATDNCGVTTDAGFRLVVNAQACTGANFTGVSGSPFSAGAAPFAAAVGDFNLDGNLDLAVANSESDNVSVLLGDGSGSFGAATNFDVGDRPETLAVGDFNRDGKLDLAIANASSANVSVLLGNGNGSFGAATNFNAGGGSPRAVAVGDFNLDGKLDLVTPRSSGFVSVLFGNGKGGFGTAASFGVGLGQTSSVAVGDFNLDGKPDLAVTNLSGSVSVLINNGSGGFGAATNFTVGDSPRSVAVGDFNRDGKPDLATANNFSNNVSVLLGNGSGGFGAATNLDVSGKTDAVTVGDFNRDGKPDLAASRFSFPAATVAVLLGDGSGGFDAFMNFGIASATSITAGDFNLDGKLDLAAPNSAGSYVSVLLNICNTPPTIMAAAPLTRQQGSPAGAPVEIATVNDAQDVPGTLAVTVIAGGTATGITVSSITNTGGSVTATVAASCAATSGTVRLQVTDSEGLTATADLQVNVTPSTPPSITSHPASQTKCVGDSVTFSVDASGTGLTYQWRKGGINIAGATGSSYTIASVAAGDAGSYDVVVSGTCGSVTSNPATLTVVVVTLSPETLPSGTLGVAYNQTITAGGGTASYTFAVTMGALPAGLMLSSGGMISGTPTLNGSFNFTVTATDANSCTGSRSYTIVIDQGWRPTSSLSTGRRFLTLTLLANGKVLAAGGLGPGGFLASAELYDPNTGQWSATGSLGVARSQHTATLLANGKVLVAGGNPGLASAELYDPSTGTSTPTGSMNAGRYSHSATLLTDGRVLVAGGFDTNIGGLSSAEIYNPATGMWTGTGSLNTPGSGHTATLLASGKVLVAGRDSNNAGAELYNPATGMWTGTASMSEGRYGHTATLLASGKVLVVGGGFGSSGVRASSELFDPAGGGGFGSWSSTASLSTARRSHTATLLPAGKVLITGGYDNSNTNFASTELFDPAGGGGMGSWAGLSSLGTAREEHVATLLASGKVIIAGGADNSFNPIASAEVYNPAAGSWADTGSLSQRRAYHTAVLLSNGKVLVIGGNHSGDLASAELYDPTTGMWTGTSSTSVTRLYHTTTLLPNGKVLVAGGRGNNGSVASAELYDPNTGMWTGTASMSTVRQAHTATLLPNGKVLVAGGQDLSGNLASAELFDPAGNGGLGSWSLTGDMNTAHVNHTATLLPGGKVFVVGSPSELYDPATGLWSTTGSLISPRAVYTASLLPNGKVLVVGGQGSSLALASAELYDPATGLWSAAGSLAAGRQEHTASVLGDGRVLVAGGHDSSSQSLDSAELYDPATGLWSSTASMRVARRAPTSTLLPSGRVLVAGGTHLINGTHDSAELYDVGLGFDNAWRPQLSSATSPLMLGSTLVAGGSQFLGISEASAGNPQSSATNYPLVQILSLANEQTVFLLSDPTANWSNTSFTSRPLPVLPLGYALVTVFTNGIPSPSRIVLINCSFAISPNSRSFPSGVGGAGSVSVTSSPACGWSAVTNSSFINITSGSAGTGPGTVNYEVAPNTGPARTGTMTIAGYSFTVTQEACAAPAISMHPANQTVCAGPSVSFSVSATGTAITYRWRKDTVPLSDGGNISGATTDTLMVNPTSATDSGSYDVVITGSCGNMTSNAATLAVNTPSAVTTNPTNQTACVGSDATFIAAASGSPAPAVQWQESTDGGTNFNNIAGATGTTLVVAAVAVSQNGNRYRAVFTNSCNTAMTSAATLTVNAYTLSATSQSFAGGGGNGSITITTSPACSWTAVSNSNFINITFGGAGTGPGTVNYAVAANTGTTIREGNITVAGQTFKVYQGIDFLDVPANDPFYTLIGKLSARGITVGCGNGNYCPNQPVTREQMAVFIIRARGEFNPPEPAMQRFDDVPATNPFYRFIDRMAVLQITVGCSATPPLYCPSNPILREQMAAFIIRALGEFNPPEPAMQRFDDVPTTSPFYRFIDRMAVLQITVGCSVTPPLYCPSNSVTRAQMAAFLVRAFGL